MLWYSEVEAPTDFLAGDRFNKMFILNPPGEQKQQPESSLPILTISCVAGSRKVTPAKLKEILHPTPSWSHCSGSKTTFISMVASS